MEERGAFRVGVLGAGAIAQVVHLPTLTQMEDVSIGAVCDPNESKARALAGRFGIPAAHEKFGPFLSEDIDAVVICTPSDLHEEQAIGALRAGKHVLVEKPLALSAEGVQRVIECAEDNQRTLMVALNGRHRPDAEALRPFATGGELGEVFYIRAGSLNRKVHALRPTWRHDPERAGGGALMDLGVQVLDLCLWMLDYPKVSRVLAHLHPGEDMPVEDSAALMVKCATGPVISVQLTWSLVGQRDRQYLEMLGSRGTASLSPLAVYKEVEQGHLDVTPQVPPGRSNIYTASYHTQLAEFVAVARGEREAPLPHEQADLMRLIALAYRSAEEGREIDV